MHVKGKASPCNSTYADVRCEIGSTRVSLHLWVLITMSGAGEFGGNEHHHPCG